MSSQPCLTSGWRGQEASCAQQQLQRWLVGRMQLVSTTGTVMLISGCGISSVMSRGQPKWTLENLSLIQFLYALWQSIDLFKLLMTLSRSLGIILKLQIVWPIFRRLISKILIYPISLLYFHVGLQSWYDIISHILYHRTNFLFSWGKGCISANWAYSTLWKPICLISLEMTRFL